MVDVKLLTPEIFFDASKTIDFDADAVPIVILVIYPKPLKLRADPLSEYPDALIAVADNELIPLILVFESKTRAFDADAVPNVRFETYPNPAKLSATPL